MKPTAKARAPREAAASNPTGTVVSDAIQQASEPEADGAHSADAPPSPATTGLQTVTMGSAVGVKQLVEVEKVLAMLGPSLLDHIAGLRANPAIASLTNQMRGSDGQDTPTVFTRVKGEAPLLFDGAAVIAAALDLGMSHIVVITMPAECAEEVQQYLVREKHERLKAPRTGS